MSRSPIRASQALAMVLALAGVLVALVIYGSMKELDVSGVLSVDAAGGRVFISAHHNVLVADEQGQFLGMLEGSPGKPWFFDDVSNVTASSDGTVQVSDAGRHEVIRFDADLHHGEKVPMKDLPRLSFESARLGDSLIVADTMGDGLRVVDSSGVTLHRKSIRYANGISIVPAKGDQPEHMVLAHTFDRHVVSVDRTLTRVTDPAATLFNLWLDRRVETEGMPPTPSHRDLLDLQLNDRGVLVAALCRTTTGDCSIVRADSSRGTIDVVGDIGAVDDPRYETSDDLLGVSEVAQRSDGAVLVASPRYRTVLLLEGEQGGAPPGRFCTRCTAEEVASGQIDLEDLERGVHTWPNGTRGSVFGDAKLRAHFDGIRKESAAYSALQRWGKLGLVALLALLLLLRFLERQGGAQTEEHLRTVWRRLVAPEWRALVAAWLMVGVGAAIGAVVLGFLLSGAGGVVGGVAAGGLLAARLFAAPFLLRRRDSLAAANAWDVYLAGASRRALELEEGEQWTGARFAYPAESFRAIARQAQDARSIDDWFEALEQLAPRLVLVGTTNRRIVTANTSLIGAPLGTIRARRWSERPQSLASVRGRLRLEPEGTELIVAPGNPSTSVVPTGPVLEHCAECSALVTSCNHGSGSITVALGLSLLLPGLGHLFQRRFGASRVQGITALALLGQALHEWLPQHWGTLTTRPLLWQRPLCGYAALLVVCALDVWRVHRREKRARERTALALREAELLRSVG